MHDMWLFFENVQLYIFVTLQDNFILRHVQIWFPNRIGSELLHVLVTQHRQKISSRRHLVGQFILPGTYAPEKKTAVSYQQWFLKTLSCTHSNTCCNLGVPLFPVRTLQYK